MIRLNLLKKHLNIYGFSLVEVIASILIISLILISMFGLILQSKKTGKSSEETIDHTYIAQETMEYMYSNVRKSRNIDELAIYISTNFSHSCGSFSVNPCTFSYNTNPNIEVIVLTKPHSKDNLVRVTVKVKKDIHDSNPVKMESIWKWKGS